MVDADNMDESVDDMTAAEIAPRPKNATQAAKTSNVIQFTEARVPSHPAGTLKRPDLRGVRYCRHKGRTSFRSSKPSFPSSEGVWP